MFVIQVTFFQILPLWQFELERSVSEILFFLLQQGLWCCSADINPVPERCLGNTILQCLGACLVSSPLCSWYTSVKIKLVPLFLSDNLIYQREVAAAAAWIAKMDCLRCSVISLKRKQSGIWCEGSSGVKIPSGFREIYLCQAFNLVSHVKKALLT